MFINCGRCDPVLTWYCFHSSLRCCSMLSLILACFSNDSRRSFRSPTVCWIRFRLSDPAADIKRCEASFMVDISFCKAAISFCSACNINIQNAIIPYVSLISVFSHFKVIILLQLKLITSIELNNHSAIYTIRSIVKNFNLNFKYIVEIG